MTEDPPAPIRSKSSMAVRRTTGDERLRRRLLLASGSPHPCDRCSASRGVWSIQEVHQGDDGADGGADARRPMPRCPRSASARAPPARTRVSALDVLEMSWVGGTSTRPCPGRDSFLPKGWTSRRRPLVFLGNSSPKTTTLESLVGESVVGGARTPVRRGARAQSTPTRAQAARTDHGASPDPRTLVRGDPRAARIPRARVRPFPVID